MDYLNWHYNGSQTSTKLGVQGYSHMAREIMDALTNLDVDLNTLAETAVYHSIPWSGFSMYPGQRKGICSMWEMTYLPPSISAGLLNFDFAITPSTHSANLFRDWVPEVYVVGCGIEPNTFYPSPNPSDDTFTVLSSATNIRKGATELAEAFTKADLPNSRLILKGTRKYVAETPNITVLDQFIPDVRDLYWNADLYVSMCFSEDTQALTPTGPKGCDELSVGDLVWTLNPGTRELEACPVEKIFLQEYSGPMVHFDNQQLDLLVTPNHRIYYTPSWDKDRLNVRNASKFVGKHSQYHFPTTARWEGRLDEFIHVDELLPEEAVEPEGRTCTIEDCRRKLYAKGMCNRHYQRNLKWGDPIYCEHHMLHDKLPVRPLLRFLGWYIAEGSTYESSMIAISNCDPDALKEIAVLAEALGLTAHIRRSRGRPDGIQLSSRPLNSILRQCGRGAKQKRIPRWALTFAPHLLHELYEGLLAGDGTRKGNHVSLYTSSDGLKDDFVELCLKLGFSTKAHHRKQGSRQLEGRTLPATTNWQIGVREEFVHGTVKPHRSVQVVPYKGRVWCVQTRNGTVFTQRNGLVVASGNSRGEGWDLIAWEALACGVPTIVPAHTAYLDWGHLAQGWLRDRVVENSIIMGMRDMGDWQVMDVDEAVDVLRWAYEHREKLREQARESSEIIRSEHTWQHRAQEIVNHLRPLRPLTDPGDPEHVRSLVWVRGLKFLSHYDVGGFASGPVKPDTEYRLPAEVARVLDEAGYVETLGPAIPNR